MEMQKHDHGADRNQAEHFGGGGNHDARDVASRGLFQAVQRG